MSLGVGSHLLVSRGSVLISARDFGAPEFCAEGLNLVVLDGADGDEGNGTVLGSFR